jgi:hypothetical protein
MVGNVVYRKSCLCVEFYHYLTKRESDYIGHFHLLLRSDKIRRIGTIFDMVDIIIMGF